MANISLRKFREVVPALCQAGYTEEDLAVKFDLSFEQVRRAKFQTQQALEQPMCLAACEEIYVLHSETKHDEIAKRYICTHLDVRTAFYSKRKYRRPTYDHAAILEYLKEYGIDAAVEHFGCHYLLPRSIARKHGVIPPARPKPTKLTREDRERIQYLNSKKLNQAEIAAELNISQSTVSRELSTNRKGPYARKTAAEWAEIVQYAKDNTVSEAHRKFKVSRAAIYAHMKEKNNG